MWNERGGENTEMESVLGTDETPYIRTDVEDTDKDTHGLTSQERHGVGVFKKEL